MEREGEQPPSCLSPNCWLQEKDQPKTINEHTKNEPQQNEELILKSLPPAPSPNLEKAEVGGAWTWMSLVFVS